MAEGRQQSLRRRCLSLGAGELAAAAAFTIVAATTVAPRLDEPAGQVALWSALARRWVEGG